MDGLVDGWMEVQERKKREKERDFEGEWFEWGENNQSQQFSPQLSPSSSPSPLPVCPLTPF